MPELPEVETTARSLNHLLPGLKITGVWTSYGGVIHRGKSHIKNQKYFSDFKKEVVGKEIKRVSRRGKNVLIELSGGRKILVHMKMTGHLLFGRYQKVGGGSKPEIPDKWEEEEWIPAEPSGSLLWDPFNRFIRLVFSLSNGKQLVLSDMRKFAKVCLLEEEKNELELLGPEPLEKNFTFSVFKEQISKKPKGKIKTVLMDQRVFAGIGNIYSDEVLFASGIHPESLVESIPDKKLKEIFVNIKKILKKGLDFGGDSTSDYRTPTGEKGSFQLHHRAYQRTGEQCSKKGCQGEILRKVVAGRSTHFCSEHQKLFNKSNKTK